MENSSSKTQVACSNFKLLRTSQRCTGSVGDLTNKALLCLQPTCTSADFLCGPALEVWNFPAVGLKVYIWQNRHISKTTVAIQQIRFFFFLRLSYVPLELMSQTAPCFTCTSMMIREEGGHSMHMHWTFISMVPWLHWQWITGMYDHF